CLHCLLLHHGPLDRGHYHQASTLHLQQPRCTDQHLSSADRCLSQVGHHSTSPIALLSRGARWKALFQRRISPLLRLAAPIHPHSCAGKAPFFLMFHISTDDCSRIIRNWDFCTFSKDFTTFSKNTNLNPLQTSRS